METSTNAVTPVPLARLVRQWLPLHRCDNCKRLFALIPELRDLKDVAGTCPNCMKETVFRLTNIQGHSKTDGRDVRLPNREVSQDAGRKD